MDPERDDERLVQTIVLSSAFRQNLRGGFSHDWRPSLRWQVRDEPNRLDSSRLQFVHYGN